MLLDGQLRGALLNAKPLLNANNDPRLAVSYVFSEGREFWIASAEGFSSAGQSGIIGFLASHEDHEELSIPIRSQSVILNNPCEHTCISIRPAPRRF